MEKVVSHLISFSLGVALVFCLGFYSLHDVRYLLSPALHFANGSSYKGSVDTKGQLTGYGKLSWSNGDEYEGEFVGGLFEGYGRLKLDKNYSYEGQFHQGRMEGIGKFLYQNGDTYEGQFSNDYFDGKGKLTYNDGPIYEGDFKGGEMTGKGKWIYTDKSTYEGEVKNGVFHGKGEWLFANGAKYTGEFENGKMHGEGVYQINEQIYSGEFVADAFTGKGTYQNEDGEIRTGVFVAWMMDGEGTKTDTNGNQWRGTFKYGELEGEGTYIGKNGELYVGEFKFGRYSGKGKLREANGDEYEGEFDFGDKDGKGILVYKEPLDGIKQVRGRWENDRLVEGDEETKIYSATEVTDYAIYYQQAAINQALSAVQPSDPNKIELYSLVVAAYGTQEVFHRESKFIENLFAVQFGNQETSIYLNNSQRSLSEKPFATLTGIKDSIFRLSQQMDKEKDIFFLYVTSHGSKDKKITLNHNGLSLGNIEAKWLGDILKATGIKHRVIVLSSCYSGGFIDDLKDEQTIVMTSAAADKTSFGCSDDSKFTYFARAYFKEALAENNDFVSAFHKAKNLVTTWEQNEKQKESNPQIYISEGVAEYIKVWAASKNLNDLNL